MRSLNRASLIGNVGSDPEIRATGTGVRVANFSLATTRRWNDRNGQQQERTEWHKVVAWDSDRGAKLAELADKYIRKGSPLFVEGEIEYRTFEDKDGNTRYVTEIRAREITLLGGRPDGDRVPVGAGAKSGDYDDFQAGGLDDDGDLPF